MRNICEIEPYTDFEIDCYSNLVMTLLAFHGFEVRYWGATWPWRLRAFRTRDGYLTYGNAANGVSDRSLWYGVHIERQLFSSSSDPMATLERLIAQDTPVIVSLDRYYLPYYSPVQRPSHGLHFILVVGFDKTANEFLVVDVVPRCYKGRLSSQDLLNAIQSYPNVSSYHVLVVPPDASDPDPEYVWERFKTSISNAYTEWLASSRGEPWDPDIAYSYDFERVLIGLIETADDTLQSRMLALSMGDWGWKSEHTGSWLRAYLGMPYPASRYPRYGEICDLSFRNTQDWMFIHRLVLKGVYGRPVDMLQRAVELLGRIQRREHDLFTLLLDSQG